MTTIPNVLSQSSFGVLATEFVSFIKLYVQFLVEKRYYDFGKAVYYSRNLSESHYIAYVEELETLFNLRGYSGSFVQPPNYYYFCGILCLLSSSSEMEAQYLQFLVETLKLSQDEIERKKNRDELSDIEMQTLSQAHIPFLEYGYSWYFSILMWSPIEQTEFALTIELESTEKGLIVVDGNLI